MATAKKESFEEAQGEEGSQIAARAPARRPPRRRAAQESAPPRRQEGVAVKKAGKKTAKKAVEERLRRRQPRTAAKKAPTNRKKPAKKSAKKAASKKRAAAPQKPNAVVPASPASEEPARPTAPRAEAGAGRQAGGAQPSDNIFYITTAIAYPNGMPHIGHAYEAIATDALARFQRLDGKDVFFLTGTDEHGLKMVQTAESEGLPTLPSSRPAMPRRFKEMDERLNVSFDRFIRTTEPAHHRSVQVIWNRMQQNGDIYIDTYAGWYSVRDEAYYAEDETVVGEDNVRRGPQGSPVEWVEEKSYFFKLSAYQDKLLALYESQPDFIGPDSRRNEVISFVKGGLKDLSISRTTFDWGVKVPERPRTRDVCLGRRADQLHHRRRLSRRERCELALLAGRRAHHRQGHHPLPRGVLAGVPDVGGHSRAEARLCPRLPVQQGREDVEVGRQRRRSLQSRRSIWRRPDALFLPARGAVRAGRQLQSRGHRRAHQCRSRQRSRQSGAALAVDDRKTARRRAAGARRVHRQRQGDPGAGRRHAGSVARRRWRRSRSING